MYSILSLTLLSAIIGLCIAPLLVALIAVGCAGKPIPTSKKQGAVRREEKTSNKENQKFERIPISSLIQIQTGKKDLSSEEKCDKSDKPSEESDRLALPFLIQTLESENAVRATPAFNRLDDITSNRPLLLLPHLHAVISLYCKIIRSVEKEEDYRTTALILLEILSREERSGMIKRHFKENIHDIISSCLQLTSAVREPNSFWFERGYISGEFAAKGAPLSLHDIVRNMDKDGSDFASIVLLKLAKELMHSDNWRWRYAGLSGVTGIEVEMKPLKPSTETVIIDVVNNIVHCLTDMHPRVVQSACDAIFAMANTLNPLLQEKCHDSIIPSLVCLLTRSSIHHIAVSAAETLDNFLNSCSKGVKSEELREIGQFLLNETKACDERRVERNATKRTDFESEMTKEMEKEMNNEAVKAEETTIERIISTVHAITKTVGSSFSREVALLIPPIFSLIEKSTNDQWKAIVFADLERIKADMHK